MWLTNLVRRSISHALPLFARGRECTGMAFGVAAREMKIFFGLYDPLTRLAARYKSDKGVTIFPFNGYSVQYANLFKRFRDRPINLLEIGRARRTD